MEKMCCKCPLLFAIVRCCPQKKDPPLSTTHLNPQTLALRPQTSDLRPQTSSLPPAYLVPTCYLPARDCTSINKNIPLRNYKSKSLPSDLRFQTSSFRPHPSDLLPHTSDFRPPTSYLKPLTSNLLPLPERSEFRVELDRS